MDPFERARAHQQAHKRRSQSKRTPLVVIDGNRLTKPRHKHKTVEVEVPSRRRVPTLTLSSPQKPTKLSQLARLQRQLVTILAQQPPTSLVASVCRHVCLSLDKLQRALTRTQAVTIATVRPLGRQLSLLTDLEGKQYKVDANAESLTERSTVSILVNPIQGIHHVDVTPTSH